MHQTPNVNAVLKEQGPVTAADNSLSSWEVRCVQEDRCLSLHLESHPPMASPPQGQDSCRQRDRAGRPGIGNSPMG